MPVVQRLPQHHDSNGWWEILDDHRTVRPLLGDVRVETAIVGGGICGLSTANRLAELCPSDALCLVEAEGVGYGASGRNAGFLLNLHSHGPPKNLNTLRRNMRLWTAGLRSLRHKVESRQIQCDWSDAGRIYGAAGPDGELHVREIIDTLDALQMPYEQQDHIALQRRIGTAFYSQGLYVPGNALVNPAALMRSLASTLPDNVAVYENSPVTYFERHGSGFRITTQAGTIVADRLVLAAGVFLKDFGIAAGRYIPMATYASLTAPLDPDTLLALGTGEEFGVLGGSEIGSTIRLTQDRRLFIRNSFNFEPGAPVSPTHASKITQRHHHAMIVRWPSLIGLSFEHSWGGVMAFTTNNGAVFGEFEKNLFAVLTNDVSPLTRGEATGALLAEHMQGVDSDLLSLQLSISGARRVPPRPILDLGIHFHRWRMNRLAAKEI